MTSTQQPDNGISPSSDNGPEEKAAGAAVDPARDDARAARSTSADDQGRQTMRHPRHSDEPAQLRNTVKALDERDQIAKRIAAFRNLQISLKQEREDYYERTLARTRAALAPDAKPTR